MNYYLWILSLLFCIGCDSPSSPSIDSLHDNGSSIIEKDTQLTAHPLIGRWHLDSVTGLSEGFSHNNFEAHYSTDSLYADYTFYPEYSTTDTTTGKWWATDSLIFIITTEGGVADLDSFYYSLDGEGHIVWNEREQSERITQYFSIITE
ncbi:MAG: hypothetical protein OCC49_12700 [Fibrobacterales bacterium]